MAPFRASQQSVGAADKSGMQINTQLAGTTTIATVQATAANTTPTTANVTHAATGSGFEVLKGTTADPLGGPPASPDDAGAEGQGAMNKAAQLFSMISTILNPPATKTDWNNYIR